MGGGEQPLWVTSKPRHFSTGAEGMPPKAAATAGKGGAATGQNLPPALQQQHSYLITSSASCCRNVPVAVPSDGGRTARLQRPGSKGLKRLPSPIFKKNQTKGRRGRPPPRRAHSRLRLAPGPLQEVARPRPPGPKPAVRPYIAKSGTPAMTGPLPLKRTHGAHCRLVRPASARSGMRSIASEESNFKNKK